MSWSALLTAVRDRIREQCGYADAECDVTFDGRPHPRAGQVFVAVHKGNRGNRDSSTGRVALDQRYDVNVTVTLRTGAVPFDRLGPAAAYKASLGLEDRVNAIIAAVHRDALDHVVVRAANALIGDTAQSGNPPIGFREGLKYQDDGPEREVAGDWFQADSPACGIASTIRFVGARRIQSILHMNGVETSG